EGFGVKVTWDVPLLDGYRSRVLPALRDPGTVSATTPLSRSLLRALRGADGQPAFDVLWVHGYASLNSLRGILAAYALDIPVLLRADIWLADRPRSPLRLLAKRLFFAALRPLVAGVLTIGSNNAAYWSFYFGKRVRQFLLPYAVDNAWFRAQATTAVSLLPALRKELDLEPGRPIILYASKLQHRKLAGDLIAGFHALQTRARTYAKPYLVIVGDGEERATLEQKAHELRLDDVRFAGFRNQTELPGFFALSDVFVLPAKHEPWGLVVNEVMASGRAVVLSSDIGAAADLVTDGVEGFVYPTGNIDALTTSLERVLASPETVKSMGAAAARRIAAWDFEADIRGLRLALGHVTHRIRFTADR
ncbi:MAG: glycosyltransferase family 4 protein, partial [Janthinobacterium lividum]